MKFIKYLGLVLTMFVGQSMASLNIGGHSNVHHQSNNEQIRAKAQQLINAERRLLSVLNYYGAAYSHAARDVRVLLKQTISLKNGTFYNVSIYKLKIKMRSIRTKFSHTRRAIARNQRLQQSSQIQFKLRTIADKISSLSGAVYASHGFASK